MRTFLFFAGGVRIWGTKVFYSWLHLGHLKQTSIPVDFKSFRELASKSPCNHALWTFLVQRRSFFFCPPLTLGASGCSPSDTGGGWLLPLWHGGVWLLPLWHGGVWLLPFWPYFLGFVFPVMTVCPLLIVWQEQEGCALSPRLCLSPCDHVSSVVSRGLNYSGEICTEAVAFALAHHKACAY